MSSTAPAVSSLNAGERVRLARLKSRQELNGCSGTLVKWDADNQRWGVRVPSIDGCISVKEDNLILVDSGASNLTAKQRSKRLCRFGQSCWRPCCHFSHEDEVARADQFMTMWAGRLHDVKEVPSVMPSSGSDLYQRIAEYESKFNAMIEKFVAQETQLDAKLESRINAAIKTCQLNSDSLTERIGHTNGKLATIQGRFDELEKTVDNRITEEQASQHEIVRKIVNDSLAEFSGAQNPEVVKMCREILGHVADLQIEVADLTTRMKTLGG